MPFFWEGIEVGGDEMKMYISVPSGPGPLPGIVIVYEGSGTDKPARDFADRLAAEGYAAVVPDIFHRMEDSASADGATRRASLSDPQIEDDINATVDFLQNYPSINGDRLGITGFCMGGRITWLMATASSQFKAAEPFYPGDTMQAWGAATRTPFDRASEISCPIMGHFGEDDGNPSPADMAKLDAELTRLGKAHQFFSYPNSGHGFMGPSEERYRKASAETSWSRTLEFFATHLK